MQEGEPVRIFIDLERCLVHETTHGEVVKELERRLKVADPVIKYLTVRLDEELKRQEKLKRHRERRAARRPRKVATAPAAPVAPIAPPTEQSAPTA